jgi:hypothetical protein
MKRCPKSDEVGVIGGRDGSPGAIDGAGLLSRKFVIWPHRSLGWRFAGADIPRISHFATALIKQQALWLQISAGSIFAEARANVFEDAVSRPNGGM